jgi:hypothetical protein
MSLDNKPYPGLISEEGKRLKQLVDLLQGLGGRHDMLTRDEQRELKSYLIKVQAAQGVLLESTK